MPPVALPDLTTCCVCRRVRTGGPEDFTEEPEILDMQGDNITSTWCPECAQRDLGISLEQYRAMSVPESADPADQLRRLISRSRHIAAECLQGQKRRGGADYMTHVDAVAAKVPDRLKPIANLHDVVENSGMTLDHLRALGMPAYVVEGVDSMTRRKSETYAEFIERLKRNPDAIPVKDADIDDNLAGDPSPSMRERYARAKRSLRTALGVPSRIGCPDLSNL